MVVSVPQTVPLEVALRQAIAHHQAGRLQEAEQLYRAILQAQPTQPDANHNLGVLAIHAGQHAAGLPYLKAALEINPDQGQYALSYAEALLATGQAAEALAILQSAMQRGLNTPAARALRKRAEASALNRSAKGGAPTPEEMNQLIALFNAGRHAELESRARLLVERYPDSGLAWKALGIALHTQGKDALAALQKAVELMPDDAEAHANLGNALRDLGRLDEAVASCRRALEINPSYAEVHCNLGVILQALGKSGDAVASHRRALEIKPDLAGAHTNLGNALRALGRLDDAAASCRRALEIRPDLAEFHHNLGNVLLDLGRLEDAVASYRRALEIKPDYVEAHRSLGNALKDVDRLDEAVASYRQALLLDPHNTDAKFDLSLAMLCAGRLTEGWAHYEHRFFKAPRRDFAHRYWQGEDLDGKSILIWGEQGVGDEIMFASMYGEILARAGRCVIECTGKLKPLFERSFARAQVVARGDPPHPATMKGIDYQCAAGSLARWLRPSLESFPQRDVYLTPSAERVAYWKARLGALGPGLKVGFCWRSSLMGGARRLYYTTLDQWGPIFAVPGVHFVNLQYDECAAELAEARQRFGIALHAFEEVDLYNDLDETAALTQGLDLVISAGTTAAAVAAALGVPTWQTSYGSDWVRHGTDHYPWHPSVRLFHRPWDQAWSETIGHIAQQLESSAGEARNG